MRSSQEDEGEGRGGKGKLSSMLHISGSVSQDV